MKRLAVLLLLSVMLLGCSAQLPLETVEPTVETLPPSLYMPEDFVLVGNFLQCTKGNTVVGIDVSSHQNVVDWELVAASGVKFAIIRLGYRGYESGTLHEDTFARVNLEGAKAAGLKVGAYFFSQAINGEEAREEALYALEILDGFFLDLPLVYDWEYIADSARTAEVDRQTLTEATQIFCREVEAAGYGAMLYFNRNLGQFRLDLKELDAYPWWIAKYSMDTEFFCRADLWQYTDQGSVPGVQTNVDINLMFTDYGLGKALFGEDSSG